MGILNGEESLANYLIILRTFKTINHKEQLYNVSEGSIIAGMMKFLGSGWTRYE